MFETIAGIARPTINSIALVARSKPTSVTNMIVKCAVDWPLVHGLPGAAFHQRE